jgi:hypothetical protein
MIKVEIHRRMLPRVKSHFAKISLVIAPLAAALPRALPALGDVNSKMLRRQWRHYHTSLIGNVLWMLANAATMNLFS